MAPRKVARSTTATEKAAPAARKVVRRRVVKKVVAKGDAPPTTPLDAPVKRVTKTKAVKATKTTKATAAAVADTTAVTPTPTPRKRREVTPETVDGAFDDLIQRINEQIEQIKEVKGQKGVKFHKSTVKQLRRLQSDTRRVAKRKRSGKKGNTNSGFLKETAISGEMAKFLGVSADTRMSRVECTKRLHNYIVSHDLQNPENRREILADKALTKVLGFNKKPVEQGGHGPLYYYVMQKLIQKHFLKDSPTPSATADASDDEDSE